MDFFSNASIAGVLQRMRQPCWPLWQWPVRAQWAAGGLVVLACAGAVAMWVWAEQSKTQETEQALGLVQAQLHALRQQAALQPDLTAPDARPTSGELGALSARWVAQAEQTGLKVSQWQINPISRVGTAASAAEPAAHKAMFSAQVQGPYGAIKTWLGQTLEAQPWLVVDKLQWRLSDVGSGMLDAQIAWSIYVAD